MKVYIIYKSFETPNPYDMPNDKFYDIYSVRATEDSAIEEAIDLIRDGYKNAWYIEKNVR